MVRVDVTRLALEKLRPYMAHIRGFIGELVVRSMLEGYVKELEERGECIVVRTEFCSRSLEETAAELLGVALGAVPAGHGTVRFEAIYFHQKRLVPKGLRVVERGKMTMYRRDSSGKLVSVEVPVKCIEFDDSLKELAEAMAGRSLCSHRGLGVGELVKAIESGSAEDACFASPSRYMEFMKEINCIIQCVKKRSGKSCFDYLVVRVTPAGDVRGVLVEVKADEDNARKLQRASTICRHECRASLTSISVAYVEPDIRVHRVVADVWGETSIVTSRRG